MELIFKRPLLQLLIGSIFVSLLPLLPTMNGYHMDATTAFLNDHLKQPVFMVQPPCCVQSGKEHLVCQLKRSLYGLRQSSRTWYERINTNLHHYGPSKTSADSNVYFQRHPKQIFILILYVDDLYITGSSSQGFIT